MSFRSVVALGAFLVPAGSFAAPVAMPPAFEVGGHDVILLVKGEGAQIYECKADSNAHLAWVFREPIATLLSEEKTVGRHYAGPNWDLEDGSGVRGKLLSSLPGAGSHDIPLLKLDIVEHRGAGSLGQARLVLRLNTRGGALTGPCDQAGEFRSEPYSADYVFLR